MTRRTRAGTTLPGVAAAVVALTLTLAGCTGLPAIPPQTHAAAVSSPSPTPSAAVSLSPARKKVDAVTATEATVAADVPEAGTVAASGSLATPNGGVGFSFRVVASGHDSYSLTTSGYHSSVRGASYSVFLRQYPESVGSCIEEGVSFGYASWGGPGVTDQIVPAVVDLAAAGDDPSFLQDIVITRSPSNASTDPCQWTVVADATLVWHAPDRHPGLTVVDSGSTVGARGTVRRTSGGTSSEPETYTIAPGDTEVGIEARFGLSRRDLVFLNARRAWALSYPIDAGQQINLNPATR